MLATLFEITDLFDPLIDDGYLLADVIITGDLPLDSAIEELTRNRYGASGPHQHGNQNA
ncbi:hypothetical protein D3C80_1816320 [compost metagenome]